LFEDVVHGDPGDDDEGRGGVDERKPIATT